MPSISTLLVVAAHLRNPILCNRLFPHEVVTTTFFTDSSSVLLSKTIAVVTAIEQLTVKLTSMHYLKSVLVQGRLEIPCHDKAEMIATEMEGRVEFFQILKMRRKNG